MASALLERYFQQGAPKIPVNLGNGTAASSRAGVFAGGDGGKAQAPSRNEGPLASKVREGVPRLDLAAFAGGKTHRQHVWKSLSAR